MHLTSYTSTCSGTKSYFILWQPLFQDKASHSCSVIPGRYMWQKKIFHKGSLAIDFKTKIFLFKSKLKQAISSKITISDKPIQYSKSWLIKSWIEDDYVSQVWSYMNSEVTSFSLISRNCNCFSQLLKHPVSFSFILHKNAVHVNSFEWHSQLKNQSRKFLYFIPANTYFIYVFSLLDCTLSSVIVVLAKTVYCWHYYTLCKIFNLSSANPTKWSNTLKQCVGFCRRIVWVCLTTSWSWRLKS